MEPVAGRTPSPSRPPPNLAASASARGPETGDPQREETAHWEMVTALLPPPEEGRVEYLVFAQEHPSCPFVEPGKGGSTPVPFPSTRGGIRCVLHYTPRPRPLQSQARPSQAPVRVPVFHHAAPPRVHLWPVGSAGTGSRSLVSAPRSVSVAPADHQTRLHDSVRPASPQVQGCPLHFSESC